MIKILVYDTKPYEKQFFTEYVKNEEIQFSFLENKLNKHTANLSQGYDGVCLFVHDECSSEVIEILAANDIKLISLRCAGYNNVDLNAAKKHNIPVTRVPSYSPNSIAEHAVALLMTLNRQTHRAYQRVKDHNFSLNGLMGFDVCGKTIGVIGTGKIGQIFIQICRGFGAEVLAYDPYPNENLSKEMGFQYVTLSDLYKSSDVISLHAPLVPDTFHLLDTEAFAQMKDNVIIINTSRGKLINSSALISALKSGKVKGAGLDVYEEEDNYFFEDCSGTVIQDDVLARLTSFNNVIITAHQGFFTEEALKSITLTTEDNIIRFFQDRQLPNQIHST